MNATVATYGVYLLLSLGLTLWVGGTLHKNGRRFLLDTFGGDAELADSVNHLLLVGFCLINFGYVVLALKLGHAVTTAQVAVEVLSEKVGLVLVVLGGMHFLNLWVFSRLRRRVTAEAAPPIVPNGRLAAWS